MKFYTLAIILTSSAMAYPGIPLGALEEALQLGGKAGARAGVRAGEEATEAAIKAGRTASVAAIDAAGARIATNLERSSVPVAGQFGAGTKSGLNPLSKVEMGAAKAANTAAQGKMVGYFQQRFQKAGWIDASGQLTKKGKWMIGVTAVSTAGGTAGTVALMNELNKHKKKMEDLAHDEANPPPPAPVVEQKSDGRPEIENAKKRMASP